VELARRIQRREFAGPQVGESGREREGHVNVND
jgi:hypothetical protein